MIVTAAFLGPGTITTASVAGARYGTTLLWAVLFAVVASVALQEMAVRLGVVTGEGLGEALRRALARPLLRAGAVTAVVLAIGVGNAAFQVGNVTGAALGIAELTGTPRGLWVALVALAAVGLLGTGHYRAIEGVLVGLVAAMGVSFLVTAALARPSLGPLLVGALRPALPEGSLLTVLALIGTTVVPYNLFLHASAAARKWRGEEEEVAIRAARRDTALSIGVGGAITASIVVTASIAFASGGEITSGAAMARQLEPALGAGAHSCFLAGLFAAGVTSAVTAPLAAGYAVAGCLGWPVGLREPRVRAVWLAVVAVGALGAGLGQRPLVAIVAAQALNAALLPLMAAFLVFAVNRSDLLGRWRNGWGGNLLAAAILAVTLGLSGAQLLQALR